MTRPASIGLLLALLLVGQFIGVAPFGRVVLAIGMPNLALPLLTDPGDRGEALFRSAAFPEAAASYREAGDDYNEGLAAAWAGDFATALAAWDRHLALHPGDSEARANHTLVTSLLSGTEFDPAAEPDPRDRNGPTLQADPGQGGARAASTGDDANNAQTGFWMPEITGEGLRRVPQIFDAQFVAANPRWLATLEDQPGRYLRARLAAEHKARVTAGTALPPPEDRQ
ncbi:MAG: hypothetical protein AAF557_08355 [Pseudomonadota bacterium]